MPGGYGLSQIRQNSNFMPSVGGGVRGASQMGGNRSPVPQGGGGNGGMFGDLLALMNSPAAQPMYGGAGTGYQPSALAQVAPYYMQFMGQQATANANRDAILGQASSQRDVGLASANSQRDVGLASAGSQRDVGLASAGSTRDVGMASADATIRAAQAAADAQRALAQAQLDAAIRTATINTGSQERIASGRNETLMSALGGWTGMLGNVFGGLGNAFGGALGGMGGGQAGNPSAVGAPPALNDPYRQYAASVRPSQLIASLRGTA